MSQLQMRCTLLAQASFGCGYCQHRWRQIVCGTNPPALFWCAYCTVDEKRTFAVHVSSPGHGFLWAIVQTPSENNGAKLPVETLALLG